VLRPRLTIRPGETQRWRIVNGAAHRALELAIERKGSGVRLPMQQIAQDGINFAVSKERQTILLAPGNRVEVLVQGGPHGIYELKSLQHDQGHPGGPRPEALLATLVSSGRRVRDPTAFPLPLLPVQMPDISKNPIANTRTVTWSGQVMTAPLEFQINGKAFDPARSDQTITVGTAEIWTLVNHDVFQHPFHIHVNPFRCSRSTARTTRSRRSGGTPSPCRPREPCRFASSSGPTSSVPPSSTATSCPTRTWA
jgi:FtsP/CotA-like multicopper oxidase with cupredoxin domain